MRVPRVHDALSDGVDGVCLPLLVVLDSFATFRVPVDAVAGLAVHSEPTSFIANRRVVDGGHLIHSLDVLHCESFVVEETFGKRIERSWAQVIHAVVLG